MGNHVADDAWSRLRSGTESASDELDGVGHPGRLVVHSRTSRDVLGVAVGADEQNAADMKSQPLKLSAGEGRVLHVAKRDSLVDDVGDAEHPDRTSLRLLASLLVGAELETSGLRLQRDDQSSLRVGHWVAEHLQEGGLQQLVEEPEGPPPLAPNCIALVEDG